LQSAYAAGETITVDSTNGTLAISGTIDDANTILSMLGGVHTGTIAENMLLITTDDQSSGYAVTINNIGGGAALDVQDNGTSNLLVGAGGSGTVAISPSTGDDATVTLLGDGAFTVDTADGGSFSIDATGAPSNLSLASTADADDLTIEVTGANNASLVLQSAGTGSDAILINASAGGMDITTADDSVWTVDAASATALVIDDGTTAFLTIDTSATTVDQVLVTPFLSMTTTGIVGTADATGVGIGDIVAIDTSGDIQIADALGGGSGAETPVGIALNADGGAGPVAIATTIGSVFSVDFDAAPATSSSGSVVYLSETAGNVTLTAPTTSGSTIYRVGILYDGTANGVLTNLDILWQPQFIANNP